MFRTLVVLVLMTGCRCSPTPTLPPDAVVLDAEPLTTVLVVDSIKSCQDCAMQLRLAIRQLEGIERFDVAMLSGRVTITHTPAVTPQRLLDVAAGAGFPATLATE